jgi:Fic family protein
MDQSPPFQITSNILHLAQAISYELGILTGAKLYPVPIALRRNNQIKTIQASLAIEGNCLNETQVTGIINAKKVIGPKKDLLEVQNAIKVYRNLSGWKPLEIDNLLAAHQQLMQDLTDTCGRWRTRDVGIFSQKTLAHMAPPAKRVPLLMEKLFDFINHNKQTTWLIKACIFHYKLEFIHPFIDGNGIIGRLWQQLLLMKEHPIFEFIAVESLIKQHQTDYYAVLGQCDRAGDSTAFIEFSLNIIEKTLKLYTKTAVSQTMHPEGRLIYAQSHFNTWFTRKDYLELHKDIASATASRDLERGISKKILVKKGQHNQAQYQFTSIE